MNTRKTQSWLSLVLTTIAAAVLFGASTAALAQSGVGKKYLARDPHTCQDPKQPPRGAPSAAQVKEYVACNIERVAATELYLIEDVTVEVGGARPFNPREDRNVPNLDPKQPLYAIRGSYKKYQCSPVSDYMKNKGKNCFLYDHPHANGYCYKDTFGDWHCGMSDSSPQLSSKAAAPPGG